MHMAAVYDGAACRLFQDGRQVAERKGVANRSAWPDDLFVGQYNERMLPDFQVFGRITGLAIYHRPLTAAEIAAAAGQRPGR